MIHRFASKTASKAGLTLIELVVILSILAILAGMMIPRVTNRMARTRDTRRLSDIAKIRDAVDQYFLDKGDYPAARHNATYGGWDVSQDGDFIPALVETGYLTEVPKDPINDEAYQYRYYVYSKGSYDCKGDTRFYILGIKAFETAEVAAKNTGYFKCSERDWSEDFAYVTGGGATDK